MKRTRILFILLALAVLQVAAVDYIRIFNVKPDLILIAVIILGFSYGTKPTLMFSFFAGALKDIFSSGLLGLNTLIFVLIGYTVSKLSRRFIIENLILRMAIISLAVLLESLIALSVLSFYASPISLGVFLKLSLLAAIYTAFISYPIIKIINYL